MKIKLTTYLDKVEAEYQDALKEWKKLNAKFEEETKRYDEVEWINLSPKGMQAEHIRHEETKKAIFDEMEKLRESFRASVASIIEDSDKVFDAVFRYSPEKVDANGIAILQNGAPSAKEIMELAEKYRLKGNYTMYFLCAEKLAGVGEGKDARALDANERKARAYWGTAKQMRETRPDHELLEGFQDVCLSGLRSDALLANGVQNIHDDLYQNRRAMTDEIEAKTQTPWE